MKQNVPPWAIAAAIAVVALLMGAWLLKANSGPSLPSNYDPTAPIGSKLTPPAGFEIPKEPEPPGPPPGVSTTPPGPGSRPTGK